MQNTLLPARTYIAIDLKSFYASVECVERGLDPLTTNLVVADTSRTEKTICLAVSPSLKKCGVSGRPRLFEVIQRVRVINAGRRAAAPGHALSGESADDTILQNSPRLASAFITAAPRMALYIAYSTRIYGIYLKHVAPEDVHVYSIDEVFIDAAPYLRAGSRSAHDLTMAMIRDVLKETGITATAGIGTNLFLAKIAMDIVAKKMPADADGVRIAELDETSFRQQLWGHRPLTDFWRIGRGYARTLEKYGMRTLGDVARRSLKNPELLYRIFGVNAELLIDHAWGWESCTMPDIKKYRPASNSLGSGQVLHCPYPAVKARVVLREMTDSLAMDLLAKKALTNQVVLTVGYDRVNSGNYTGDYTVDRYGRRIPKHAHGTENLEEYTSSASIMTAAVLNLFDRIVDKTLQIRRLNLTACHVLPENDPKIVKVIHQLSLFSCLPLPKNDTNHAQIKERKQQEALLLIRQRYGKNAILKGTNFDEGATGRDRNNQIGGHKA